MNDEIPTPIPNVMAVQKISALIGNGQGTIFDIEHPAAPNVVVQMFRTVGGEGVYGYSLFHDRGKVSLGFANPPGENEFIAVVMG